MLWKLKRKSLIWLSSALRNWSDAINEYLWNDKVEVSFQAVEQMLAADGAKADPIPGTIWVWDHARPLYWKEYQRWLKEPLPFGWAIIRAPEEGAQSPRR